MPKSKHLLPARNVVQNRNTEIGVEVGKIGDDSQKDNLLFAKRDLILTC
jgi:hypothetical protein